MQLELKRLQVEVGITFVVVTHDQEEAMSMADRIAVMHDGRVQQVDTPVDLYQRPRNLFVADFVGTSNAFTGVRTDEGVDVPGLGILPGHPPRPVDTPIATLILRPEEALLVGPEDAVLSGTVIDIQFYGGSSTIAVEVAGHPTPVIVTRHGATAIERGETVHLSWGAGKAVVLGEEP
jgi:ABC-type Fe3+/spermidine/putrescine transport system ATPase subunit